MIYGISTGRVIYHDFEKEIQKVARLPPSNKTYISLFGFGDCADLTRRLGTSRYLMSPLKVDQTAGGITGADRFPIKEMCMSTNERSSSPAARP